MKLPRPRFTMRWMMIVVAVAAVALGAIDVWRRQDRFLALRSNHEWSARGCLAMAESHASTAAGNEREVERLRAAATSGDGAMRRQAELSAQITANIEAQAAVERAAERKYRARAQFHDALRIKYERAARYPWKSVEPDPPEPE